MRTLAVLLCILLFLGGYIMTRNDPAGVKAASEPTPSTMKPTDSAQPLKLNPLTPAEERVILHKGTEAPFTGEFEHLTKKGLYLCKQCDAPLYRSEAKFDAGCGWPAFDDEIPGAVRRIPDADGQRTEIVCARCGAHLGHVFLGEHFTAKDTRHCVNSISMKFQPDSDTPAPAPAAVAAATSETAIFASGCFWGSEYVLEHVPGVRSTRVGYSGGRTEHPTYQQVCTGTTGHAEAVEVVFDPRRTTYEALARIFFENHDPTQVGGQGPDHGDQYRSVVFYANDAQKQVAQRLIDELRHKGLKVATKLEPAGKFWPAEGYHQKYYDHKGGKPYCHFPRKLF